MDDLFYGKPDRVRYVAGGGGGGDYRNRDFDLGRTYHRREYQLGPQYYSDGEDYYSHRYGGRAPSYPSSSSGRAMLPDVILRVPMDSQRCAEKVKHALATNGVYSVHCCVPTGTVTVSGNIAPQALLKRVKQVKRKSKILSYSSHPAHIVPHHGYSSPSSAAALGSSSYRPAHMISDPQWDLTYYNRNGQQPTVLPANHHNYYRPSHHHHYSNLY